MKKINIIVSCVLICLNLYSSVEYDQALDKELIQAAMNNNFSEVEYLVSRGANLNAVDSNGNTALHLMASYGWFDMANLLVTKGANLNSVDSKGNTALHLIAYYGLRLDIAKLLIENGADLNILNNEGKTAVYLAASYGRIETSKLFDKHDKYRELRHSLIEGQTLLHIACVLGKIELAISLIQEGADINATNNNGQTPLHLAVLLKHLDIIKLLIDKSANVNAVTNNGVTSLDLAAGYPELQQPLREAGAIYSPKTGTVVELTSSKVVFSTAMLVALVAPYLNEYIQHYGFLIQ